MGNSEAFATANNARDSDYYQVQGAKFLLPSGYESAVQPEWRLAHFAVVVPVPGLPEKFEWPEGWVPGRFRGIKTIEFAGQTESGSYGCQFKGEYRNFDFAPRVFHKSAGSYFREPLTSSMGAHALDASPNYGDGPGEWSSGQKNNPARVVARRFMFEPDLTSEHWQKAPTVNSDSLPIPFEDSGHSYSSFRLVCAEFLNYSGPRLYDLDSGEPYAFEQNFLVIHAVAENCSGRQLEKVTASLTKPRELIDKPSEKFLNQVPEWVRLLVDQATVQRKRGNPQINLLKLAVGAAEKKLFSRDALGSVWEVTNGGYIKMLRQNGGSRPSQQAAKPYCVTMAIPGIDDLAQPTPLRRDFEGKVGDWTSHDKWAWYLASRFDRYTTEIPDFHDASLAQSLVARYRDWTIHSCEGGLAVVRREPLGTSQNNFFMLSGTRFVDLAILTLRANNYLGCIGEQLRQLSFGPEALNVLDSSESELGAGTLQEIKHADQQLQRSLRQFAKIQAEFVYLRDHLWYERVPGRAEATTILQHILEKTGARRNFDDIVSEIEIRENVYTTQYNFARIRLDGVEAASNKREEERRDKRNAIIAFAAVALAFPSLFALLPGAGGWWVFLACLATTAVIAPTVAYLLYRRWGDEPR